MADAGTKLKAIPAELVRDAPKSDEDLLRLLSDGLGWPLGPAEEVDRKVLLNWDPAELDLEPGSVPQLDTIQSIRPKDASQQFGVFLLKTTGGDLPIGALRRLLDTLVRRSRKTKTGAPHQFGMNDLLFVVSGEGGSRQVHFAVFHEEEGRAARLRVISWGENETEETIRRLSNNQLPILRWPVVNEQAAQWRDDWLEVIHSGYREGAKSAKQLALQMAEFARDIRDEVTRLMAVETENGPTTKLFRQMKEQLIADLDPERFADLYAQTIVYGLLAARIASQAEGERSDEFDDVHPFENVLLDTMYGRLSKDEDEGVDLDQLGLHELNEYLATVDVAEILASFGKEEQDPVIHFYEDFVKAYDPGRQLALGIFYTPTPVVRYIVRSVDRRLKEEFGLQMGVADSTPWSEVAERLGIEIPPGADPDSPFVSMLDPATGTGTFLVEWIRQAEASFKEVASAGGLGGDELQLEWESHLVGVVVPQMAAFELELASYSVAHLKVSAVLPPALRGRVRLPIYLTNALSEQAGSSFVFDDDPLSSEGERADQVKKERIITVVVGNPPYKGKASSDEGGVVVDAATPRGGPRLDDFSGAAEFDVGVHAKHLRNLYLYFWRWTLWKVFEQSGTGIVAMITSAAWISGVPFPGMRAWLQRNASDVVVLDLPGDNVFDIKGVGVAIAEASRVSGSDEKCRYAHIRISALAGTREEKFVALAKDEAVQSVPLSNLELGARFAEQPSSSWAAAPAPVELVPWFSSGVQSNRTWVFCADPETLQDRYSRLINQTDVHLKRELFKEYLERGSRSAAASFTIDHLGASSGLRGFAHARLSLSEEDESGAQITRCGYRAFDRQWIIADDRVLHRPRPSLWEAHSENQVYMVENHVDQSTGGPGVVFSALVPECGFFSGGNGRVLPMFRDREAKMPNVAAGLLEFLSERLERTVSAHDLFAYIASTVAHSGFVECFEDDLATAGVRVPVTADGALFSRAVDVGSMVIWLHTYGERFVSDADGRPAGPPRVAPGPDAPREEIKVPVSPLAAPDRVTFNAASKTLEVGDGSIGNVSEQVWRYRVNNMAVIQSWFKYRRLNAGGISGSPLNEIRPPWTSQTNVELLDLLHVLTLVVDLEPAQDQLLSEIVDAPKITLSDLNDAGVLPFPAEAKSAPVSSN